MKGQGSTAPRRKGWRRSALFACMVSLALASTGLSACAGTGTQSTGDTTQTKVEQHYTPGTYTGVGEGNGGDITVDVTFSENAITDIQVASQSETKAVSADFTNPDAAGALTQLPQDIVDNQSLGVDSISGATLTSAGIKTAVADAVQQAGGDVAALRNAGKPAKTDATEDMDADVVVVGAGGSGMAATIRLGQLGKKVILVEKTYRLGGSISVSGGNQVVQGSQLQKDCGVTDDSAESMIADFQKNGDNMCTPDLIALYANNVGATTDWLNQSLGVQYDTQTGLHNLAEYSYKRELAYAGGGAAAAATLRSQVYATGATVLTDTTAQSLVTENGKVTGLVAQNSDGTTYNIKADDVVLCTGGYGNSEEWLSDELKGDLYYGLATSTGDGLTMATADDVDAATTMLDYAKLYPNGVEVSEGRAKSTIDGNLLVWKKSAILVNDKGVRVVNEHASNHDILSVELAQDNSQLYLVMDQANFDVWKSKLANTGIGDKALQQYLDANGTSTPLFAHGDTLAEAAKAAGIDATALQATVDKYNAGVSAGSDEFGRSGEFLKETIGDGPYYIVEQKPRYATTMGGLVVNTNLQVMNNDGKAIEGLYAAGEVVGGVQGSNSPSGANNAWALTSGKLAAEAIAGSSSK